MKKVLFFAFLLSTTLQAQTLEECQGWARDNYPLSRKYGLIDKTTTYTVSNVQKGYLPQISASAQTTFQSGVVNFPEAFRPMLEAQGYNLKGINKFQYKAGIDVQQIVYDGGNIQNQKEIAKLQGEVQNAQNDVDMYQLRDRINNLYFGILLLSEKIKLNEEHLKLISANRQKLEAKFNGGIAMQADVNLLKAEEISIKQSNIELKTTKQSYLNVLSIFCGKKIESVKPQHSSPNTLPAMTDESSIRPEWDLFDKQTNLIHAKEKQLRTTLLPKVFIFASGYYGYPGYDLYHDMFHRNPTLNGMIGLKVNWSISNFYTNRNNRLKFANQRELIQNQRELFTFNNNIMLSQEKDAISRYKELLTEDEELITLRKYVRKATEAKLEGGIVDVNDLLQEITRENQARITKSTHEIEMQKHIAELKYVKGNK